MMERRLSRQCGWPVHALIVATLVVLPLIATRTAQASEVPRWDVDDIPAPPVTVMLCKDAAELAVQADEPATEWAEPEYAEPYVEEVYCEPAYEPMYNGPACSGDGGDFRTQGVVQDGGTTYTWYSQAVLPGGGLDIPGRNVNSDGYVCDGDGNICVASSDYEYGTELDTPFGSAVVYDTGCASGVVDVYTDW